MDRKIVKRIPKSRKEHICIECGNVMIKGTVYYRIKQIYHVYNCEPSFGSFEIKQCPKCKYKERRHYERYADFTERCEHPKKFIDTVYDYIPGEAAMEPQYDQCLLCGKVLIYSGFFV